VVVREGTIRSPRQDRGPRLTTAVRKRIIDLLEPRVGLNGALLEFRVFQNQIWWALSGLVTAVGAIATAETKEWSTGAIVIAGFLGMTTFVIRRFVLRHRFFLAVSADLNTPVTWRHPVRGVPNWRRQLSDDRMKQLDAQYANWCRMHGIVPFPFRTPP